MRVSPIVAGAALVLALSSCGSSAPSRDAGSAAQPAPRGTVTAPTRPSATPTRRTPAPAWVVGAHPLPLRADGYGEVLPTPVVLRDRRLQGADTLPPPTDGRYHATTGPITAALLLRMGRTYTRGCPVPPSRLSYLTLTFEGFDGRAHTGELVVATSAATQVVAIFRDLWAQRFPIEQMRLPTTADLTAHPTGDGNDTAAFVCRAARGQTRFSAHAYGLAIDLDPFDNPYSKGSVVLPELASAYLDRTDVRPGMLLAGSPAVRAFTSRGWVWGGNWHTPVDRQHFSLTGD